MPDILVYFQNLSPIVVKLEQSETARLYLEVFQRNLAKEPPTYRDLTKYNLEYFKKLVLQVKQTLGWDWNAEHIGYAETIKYHKDIEDALLKENSFDNIPGDHQNLIHEAHNCLHNMEVDPNYPHGDFLQFEWFNGDYEIMPEDKEFSMEPEFGDIVLQNPYVGHPPIQCYTFDDHKQIHRTCAFQDRIKPALKIELQEHRDTIDTDRYNKWWQDNCPTFVETHSMDKILRYTGWPVIGKVNDLKYLREVVQRKELKFERLEIV